MSLKKLSYNDYNKKYLNANEINKGTVRKATKAEYAAYQNKMKSSIDLIYNGENLGKISAQGQNALAQGHRAYVGTSDLEKETIKKFWDKYDNELVDLADKEGNVYGTITRNNLNEYSKGTLDRSKLSSKEKETINAFESSNNKKKVDLIGADGKNYGKISFGVLKNLPSTTTKTNFYDDEDKKTALKYLSVATGLKENELEVLARYGLGVELEIGDLANWAREHNFDMAMDSNGMTWFNPKRKINGEYSYWGTGLGIGTVIPTKQEMEDLDVLEKISADQGAKALAEKYPIMTSVANIIAAPGQAMAGLIATIDDTINTTLGKPIDEYSPAKQTVRNGLIQRSTVAKDMSSTEAWWYNTAMSAGENMAITAFSYGLSNGNSAAAQWISSGLMASLASQREIISAKERGLSDEKAIMLGLSTAGVEFLTEKISVGKIFKPGKSFVGKMGKTFLSEGLEEMTSGTIMTGVDYAISGDKSDISMAYNKYRKEGKSAADARWAVFGDKALEIGLEGLSGGVSGVGMGSVYSAINYGNIKDGGVAIKKGIGVDGMIEIANDFDKKTDTYKYAEKLRKKLESGKKITDYEAGNLYALALEESNNPKKAYGKYVSEDVMELRKSYIKSGFNNGDLLVATHNAIMAEKAIESTDKTLMDVHRGAVRLAQLTYGDIQSAYGSADVGFAELYVSALNNFTNEAMTKFNSGALAQVAAESIYKNNPALFETLSEGGEHNVGYRLVEMAMAEGEKTKEGEVFRNILDKASERFKNSHKTVFGEQDKTDTLSEVAKALDALTTGENENIIESDKDNVPDKSVESKATPEKSNTISSVIMAMEGSFKPGALNRLMAQLDASGKTFEDLVHGAIAYYRKTGNIGNISGYFADEGKAFIEAIESLEGENNGEVLLHEHTKGNDESSGEQIEGVQGTEEEVGGRSYTAENLRNEGKTERINIDKDNSCEVIKEDAYTEDMLELAGFLKKYGLEAKFFVGDGWNSAENVEFAGCIVGGKEVYIQYDHAEQTPEMIAKHEIIHSLYGTAIIKKIRNILKNSYSVAELNHILNDGRYSGYMEIYKDTGKVFEEFVCDTLSGMNGQSMVFETLVNAFWSNDFNAIDNYKVSEYAEETDAGGEEGKTLREAYRAERKAEIEKSKERLGIADNNESSEIAEGEIRYSIFPGGVFPPYNKSHSDANERATRWAHNEDIETGAQRIFFYKGAAYLVEKFDSMDLGYLVVEKLKKKDLEMWEARKNRKVGKKNGKVNTEYAGSRSAVSDNGQNRGSSESSRGSLDDNNSSDRHNGETAEVQGMDREQDGKRSSEHDGSRDNEHSVEDREREVKFSVAEKAEEAFKDSVVRGEDGKLKVMYHGTKAEFNSFDISKNKTIQLGNGFYFGENKANVEKNYAGEEGRVIEAYLNIKNPFVITQNDMHTLYSATDTISEKLGIGVTEESIMKVLKEHGYDGIHYVGVKKGNDIWVAYDSVQIRSADEVTYDDDGNEIPLEKRFSDSKDIRYNLSGKKKGDEDSGYEQNNNSEELGQNQNNGKIIITKKDVEAVQNIPRKSISQFTSQEIADTENFARKYFAEMGVKSPFFRAWFGDWRANDITPIQVVTQKSSNRGTFKNEDTTWNIQISGKVFAETKVQNSVKVKKAIPYLDYIDGIIENAVLLDTYTIPQAKAKSNNSAMMHSLYAVVNDGKGQEVLKLLVEELNDVNSDGTILRSYQLQDIIKIPTASVRVRNNPSSLTNTIGTIRSVSDLFGVVKAFDKDFKYSEPSVIRNADGTPKVLYHQTENTFTIFDTRHEGAGTRDNETPFGIFMKSTPSNIGLNGDIQMPLYANIRKPLEANDRNQLVYKLKQMSSEFKELHEQHKELDKHYQAKFDNAMKELRDYLIEWRNKNPDASRRAVYDDETFNKLHDAEDIVLEEWEAEAKKLEIKTKEVITATLIQNGYDGVMLKYDEGSFGKKTDTYIALDSTQVKSAIDNIGTFDKNNPDIRYNLTTKTQDDIIKIAEGIQSYEDFVELARKNKEEFVSAARSNKNLQKRLENAKKQVKVTTTPIANKLKAGKITRDIIAEMEGTITARELEDKVMDAYNSYLTAIKKSGKVESKVQSANDEMIKAFTDIAIDIVDSASTYVESDDYVALRDWLKGTAIKIPDDAKADLDYATFRKKNYGRINLTNDGLPMDIAYKELCSLFPHLFSENTTHPSDQAQAVVDTLKNLKDISFNPHEEYFDDAVEYVVSRFVSEADGIVDTSTTRADRLVQKASVEKEEAVAKAKADFEKKLTRHKEEAENRIKKLQGQINALKYEKFWEGHLSKEERQKAIKDMRERQKVAKLKADIRKIASRFKEGLDKTEKAGGYPKELVKSVAEVCSALDFHTDRTGKDGSPTKVSLKLDALKTEYDNLKTSEVYDFKSEYSEELSDHIAKLNALVKDKRIVDLTSFELENLKDILSEIRHRLSNASKQIGIDNAMENIEIGQGIIEDWEKNPDLYDYDKSAITRKVNSLGSSTKSFILNPHRVNKMLAGYNENSLWWKLYDQINRGMRKASKFTMDATKPFDVLTGGNRGNEIAYFDFRTKEYGTGITDKHGREVKMTKAMICELIMAWDRPQGRSHLEGGGVKVPHIKEYNKGNTSVAIKDAARRTRAITQSDITRLKGMLDSYDLAWIEAAQYLFEIRGKSAINETSMQLLGREIAKAKNYIRLYVDKDFVKTDIEGIKVDMSLEGNGSLKSTVQNAKQPLIIRGLNENVFDHIDFVAKYSGLAIPIRNFNKVYNIAITDEDGEKSSLKETISKKYGSKIQTGVIEQMIKDLQMPRERGGGGIAWVRGKWLNATFWGNIRSMLKQTTSYWTASSKLSEASLMKGLKNFTKHPKVTKAEIEKYTGTLYKREQGLSTVELGDRAMRKRLAGASSMLAKGINKYAPWLRGVPEGLRPGNWLQAMDCTVATALWEASKAEIQSRGIKASDEGYWQAVTDLYDSVIEETQSNYDVLHRPEALKSTNQLTQTLTMFQTDNLQQTGILYDAYNELHSKSKAYKEEASTENKKALAGARKVFGKAVRSRVYSMVWLAFATMAGNMLLRKFEPYRDEEEKDITAKSVGKQLLISMGEDMFGVLVPVGGNLIMQAADTWSEGYDFVSEPAFDTMQNFIETSSKLYDAFSSDKEGQEYREGIYKALSKFIPSVSNITGVPVKNVTDWFKAIDGYVGDIKEGKFAHDINDNVTGSLYKYSDLAAAISSGNNAQEKKILEYYKDNGKEINKGQLGSELKSGYVSLMVEEPKKAVLLKNKLVKEYGYSEEAIREWVYDVYLDTITYDTDSAAEIKKVATKYGIQWTNAVIEKQAKSSYEKYLGDESEKAEKLKKALVREGVPAATFEVWEKQYHAKEKYSYDDLVQAILSGDEQSCEDIADTYADAKITIAKGTLTTNLRPKYMELYISAPDEARRIREQLISDFGYKSETVDGWVYKGIADAILADDVNMQNKIKNAASSNGLQIKNSKVVSELKDNYVDLYITDPKEAERILEVLRSDYGMDDKTLQKWKEKVEE